MSGQVSIPVRNIRWLMLYASDLGREAAPALQAVEALPEEIPDLVAEILARAVEQRQRRQLSTAFRHREAVLSRVRGRIDHLSPALRQLLAQGRIACRFEELTVDSPRNPYVRTALDSVARLVHKPELAYRCRGPRPCPAAAGIGGMNRRRASRSVANVSAVMTGRIRRCSRQPGWRWIWPCPPRGPAPMPCSILSAACTGSGGSLRRRSAAFSAFTLTTPTGL
jgi:hypothetical protein